MSLPIIDISNPDDRTVGKAMLDAAVRYGFFYVSSQSTDFKAGDVQRAFSMVHTQRDTQHPETDRANKPVPRVLRISKGREDTLHDFQCTPPPSPITHHQDQDLEPREEAEQNRTEDGLECTLRR